MKGFFSDDVNISFFELEDSGGYSLRGHHELKVHRNRLQLPTMFLHTYSGEFMGRLQTLVVESSSLNMFKK